MSECLIITHAARGARETSFPLRCLVINRGHEMQNDMTIDGFNISTWHAAHLPPNEQPYQAVNMTMAAAKLEGCELTDDEKTKLPEMMAGYCRLIDEAGLIGFGETEFESIQDLFSKATRADL